MCALRPESQPHPGLLPKQGGQQSERGDSAPLLCSPLVRPHLEYCIRLWDPLQEGRGLVGKSPEKGREVYRGPEELPVQRQAKKVWAVQSQRITDTNSKRRSVA